jgi:hypothetical protein
MPKRVSKPRRKVPYLTREEKDFLNRITTSGNFTLEQVLYRYDATPGKLHIEMGEFVGQLSSAPEPCADDQVHSAKVPVAAVKPARRGPSELTKSWANHFSNHQYSLEAVAELANIPV